LGAVACAAASVGIAAAITQPRHTCEIRMHSPPEGEYD
jgi:hypothetical protein